MPAYRLKDSVLKSLVPHEIEQYKDDFIKGENLKPIIETLSMTGSLIGQPLGLLPLLSSFFSAGEGKLAEIATNRIYEGFRFTPEIALQLYLRSYPSEAEREKFLFDLHDSGWSFERIEALKELGHLIPNVQDLIRMGVKEVFTPEIAEAFGQYEDIPKALYPYAEKIGLTKEWVDRYWAAHWDLPSVSQAFEMRHRGIISTDEELELLLRALDIMPHWRKKLMSISYNVLTRVDARRMWDMRIIDDLRLFQVYKDEGYTDTDAEALTTWTKVYQTFPDLVARYKNGWINGETVVAELIRLGMDNVAATELYQTKVKAPNQDRLAEERNLTKSEIIKAFNAGLFTYQETQQALVSMGYDTDETEIILLINENQQKAAIAKRKQLTRTELLKGYKQGFLTRLDVLGRLIAQGYDTFDADLIIKINDDVEKALTQSEKNLTRVDIINAFKRKLLSDDDTRDLLVKSGYDQTESNFIIALNLPVPTGETTTTEINELIESFRKASGLKH